MAGTTALRYYEQGVRASGTVVVNVDKNNGQAILTLPALSNGRYKLELLPRNRPTKLTLAYK